MNLVNDILGWGLMILGIVLILIMITSATNKLILLSMALSIPATIVFRSGVGFLRMSTAYRLARKLDKHEP